MKRLAAGFALLLACAVGGWYVATHRTGDWVVTVLEPGGEVGSCFKASDTMLVTSVFDGTVRWQIGDRQYRFAKTAVRAYPVRDGQWIPAFAAAGIDGELCTNGPYPDPVVLAQRLAARAIQAVREQMPALGQRARELTDQAAEGFRKLLGE